MQIRTNPFIYLFHKPIEESLTILEPFEKRYFEITNTFLLDLLDFAKTWKSATEIKKLIKSSNNKISRETFELVFSNLLEQNILIGKNHPINKIFYSSKQWFSNGWDSAFYYHLTSRDYKFLDYSKEEDVLSDRKLMQKYAKLSPPPPIYKTYKNCKFFKLPKISQRLLRLKFHSNKEHNVILTTQKLSNFLYLTFGETGSVNFPVFGKSLLKTSPSGGARHPSEAYLVLLKDINIPVGVYHYSVKKHGLELIEERNFSKFVNEIFFQLNHFPEFEPQAIIVITSLFERSMWRYREPRSFRVILFDIGHLLATLRVVSQAMGFRVLIGHGFSDEKVKEMLALEEGDERPFYFVAIGSFKNENYLKQ